MNRSRRMLSRRIEVPLQNDSADVIEVDWKWIQTGVTGYLASPFFGTPAPYILGYLAPPC